MVSNIKSFHESSVMFSFIRDPIDLFVSAASEVVSQGSIVNRGKKECFGADHGTGYMQCFLTKLLAGEVVDMHFVPQSVELYRFAMGSEKVKISLSAMNQIGAVQRMMGIDPFAGNKKKGIKTQYTVDKMTPEMIQDVCKVYSMDVAMARASGILVPRCPQSAVAL
jgi:hypothetical protein